MTDEEFQLEVEKLAKSPAVERVFDAMAQKYAEAWLLSPERDHEHREHLHRMVVTIRNLRGSLQSIASDPKVLEWNQRLASKKR